MTKHNELLASPREYFVDSGIKIGIQTTGTKLPNNDLIYL